jgi:hemerythrin
MEFIWSENYSVEIPEIDAQHKHFLELANAIIDLAEKGGADNETLIPLVKEFNDYAQYHLTTEEKYFKEFNYEEADIHIAMHDNFRTQVLKYDILAEGEVRPPSEIAKDLALFAGNWLQSHIIIMDKKYVANFHRHGLGVVRQ